MKTIYIHTTYLSLLNHWIEKYQVHLEQESPLTFEDGQKINVFKLMFAERMLPFLVTLLEEMALLHHPIIQDTTIKLAVIEHVFTPIRQQVMLDLQHYIANHHIINLEGYYKFRMENHNTHLNNMMYHVIKNHLQI